MDISSVVSPRVSTGSGEGASSPVRVPVADPVQAGVASAPVAVAASAPSSDQVAQAVNQINDAFAQRNQNLYAAIEKDKATGIDVVKIVDRESKETISQFPSKAILGIADAIQNPSGAGGRLLRDQA
jgi:uncharacterized FlaG/YvyC family protein